MSNVCTRCGQERIIIDEWTENIQTGQRASFIRHMKTSCPDPECQKKVEEGIEKEKQKNEIRRVEKIEVQKMQKEEREKRIAQLLLKANKRK